jgi:hypothetical protein
MNRIFSEQIDGGWPAFPIHSFARLDHFEPADLDKTDEAVFSFDAVDAGWLSTRFMQVFPEATANIVHSRMAGFWKALFGNGSSSELDFFDEIPVYNIEVTVQRGDAFWGVVIPMINREDWVQIRLSDLGSFSVDVYGSILADPLRPYLQAISPAPANVSQLLSALFDVGHWPDATDREVDAVLKTPSPFETLAMYDVGQGSAIAPHGSCQHSQPVL